MTHQADRGESSKVYLLALATGMAVIFAAGLMAGEPPSKPSADHRSPQYKAPAKPGDRIAAGYVPTRLDIGQPDLQGIWTATSNTRLERPSKFHSLTLSDEEARKAAASDPVNIRLKTDDNQKLTDGLPNGKDLAVGRGYNAFWFEPVDSFGNVKGTWRTSWIVDPADGKIPYADPRNRLPRTGLRGTAYDNPEERTLAERCLTWSAGPPIVGGAGGYNSNFRISQSPNAVVITAEGFHDARIIRLDAKHQSGVIKPFYGDSIGRWEGDTLVVETVNINPEQTERGRMLLSPSAKVIERFTRYSDKQILYEFEIDDPVYYTQVWKGEEALHPTDGDMYEVACHEGNYGLKGILNAGRVNDRKGIPNVPEEQGSTAATFEAN